MEKNEEPKYRNSLQAVEFGIWEDAKKRGKWYFKVTVLRRYQVDDDDFTKTTSYTGPSRKVLVSELLQLAKRLLKEDNPMQSKGF